MYQSAEKLQKKIEEYFDGGYRKRTVVNKEGETVEVPDITISDLVLYLGFCDRKAFYDYGNKPEFSHTIKRARTFIEREYESCLRQQGLSAAGPIFALKNFGWTDRQELDITSKDEKIETSAEIVRRMAFLMAQNAEKAGDTDKT